MLSVFRDKPSIVLEAQKARFQPRLILQILIFIAVFLVAQIAASLPLIFITIGKVVSDIIGNRVSLENPASISGDYVTGLVSNFSIVMLFCTVIATILTIIYCRYIERRSLYSMGFVKKSAISDYSKGLLIGATMFGTSVLIAWLSGSLEFNGVVLGNSIGLVIAFFFSFLFQGMSEEVILRGYFMVSIATKKPIIVAVLVNSIVFSLLHSINNGITVLAIINLTLFGIFASIYVLKSDSIWGICAMHSTWNFTQGNIFGISVSGLDVKASILSFVPTDTNAIINGGTFGLEGGLAVTIVLVAATIIVMQLKGRTKNT